MRFRTRVPLAVRLSLSTVLVIIACDSGDLTGGDQVDLSVRLVNSEDLPVHLFGPGETFPCCQVAAAGSRLLNKSLKRGQSLEFRSGRNAEILGSISCRVDLASSGETVSVTWSGANLACAANW